MDPNPHVYVRERNVNVKGVLSRSSIAWHEQARLAILCRLTSGDRNPKNELSPSNKAGASTSNRVGPQISPRLFF